MGYLYVIGACVSCRVPLSFNPTHVPSIRINGSREPLCRGCVARWEEIHGKEIAIHPDAYEPEEVP